MDITISRPIKLQNQKWLVSLCFHNFKNIPEIKYVEYEFITENERRKITDFKSGFYCDYVIENWKHFQVKVTVYSVKSERLINKEIFLENETKQFLLEDAVKYPQNDSTVEDKNNKDIKNQIENISNKLDNIDDKLNYLQLEIQQDKKIKITSPGIEKAIIIKLSTPASGFLPSSVEARVKIDISNISYDQLKEIIKNKYGQHAERIIPKLEENAYISNLFKKRIN